MNESLEILRLQQRHDQSLAKFFELLIEDGSDKFFHPHPFTREEAQRITTYLGQDLYYGLFVGAEIIGYGMLRGWDEGFTVPSLGICLLKSYQGRKYGHLLMHFLHAAARQRGSSKVQLRVFADNRAACHLYESLGYHFVGEKDGQLVGVLDL